METKYLLLVFLLVTDVGGAVIPDRSMHDIFERTTAQIKNASLPPYNSTIECTAHLGLAQPFDPFFYGYPWAGKTVSRKKDVTDGLSDPFDAINHVCDISDRARVRLRDSGVRDYCLLTNAEATSYEPIFIPRFSLFATTSAAMKTCSTPSSVSTTIDCLLCSTSTSVVNTALVFWIVSRK